MRHDGLVCPNENSERPSGHRDGTSSRVHSWLPWPRSLLLPCARPSPPAIAAEEASRLLRRLRSSASAPTSAPSFLSDFSFYCLASKKLSTVFQVPSVAPSTHPRSSSVSPTNARIASRPWQRALGVSHSQQQRTETASTAASYPFALDLLAAPCFALDFWPSVQAREAISSARSNQPLQSKLPDAQL